MLAPWMIEKLREEKEERERVEHRIWLPIPEPVRKPKPVPTKPERGYIEFEI